MNAWKVILSTLVIFIAGVITGGLLVTNALRVLQNHPKTPASLSPQAANPWQVKNHDLLRRMDRELDLTPEQHNHIETIIAASQERTKQLWKPIAPQMFRETQAVHAEIRDQLTADQKKKFDEFPKARPNPEKRRNGTNLLSLGQTNTAVTNLPDTNSLPANP